MTVDIRIGDCRELLKAMDAESVDCVVTSNPYWGLRSYLDDGHADKRLELGNERTLAEHVHNLVDVFRDIRRVLKIEGTCWLNTGDCYATTVNGRSAADTKAAGRDDRTFRDKPFDTAKASGLKLGNLCLVPERLSIALQDDGWIVRKNIIWGKPNPLPDSRGSDRPSTAHERILLLAKKLGHYYNARSVGLPVAASSRARLAQNVAAQKGSDRANGGRKTNGAMRAVGNKDWRNCRDYEPEVWRIATAASTDAHTATFPPELVDICLRAGCPPGGVVLDPFFGSGTVGLVAEGFGLTTIGLELNPEYAEIARNRILCERQTKVIGMPAPKMRGLPLLDAIAANGGGE